MYTKPFIPRADAAFRTMARNFAEGVSRNPAQFMLTPAEASKIMEDFVRFDEAYSIAVSPKTRTRCTICDKDDARSILRDTIRNYAAFIRPNLGITDGDKINIGVRPRNIAHGDRTSPTTQPLLNYIGSLPGMDQLVYHSSDTPTSKAKPRGVERLELWVAYSKPGEPRPKIADARLVGSFKKSKMLVPQDRERDVRLEGDGKPTYWAHWVGFHGDVGPWSLPLFLSSLKKKPAKTATAGGKTAKPEQAANADDDQSLLPIRIAA